MDFSLELPTQEEVRAEVVEDLKPAESVVNAISSSVEDKVSQVFSMDLSQTKQVMEVSNVFQNFGLDVLKQSEQKNSIMQRRLGELSKQGSETGTVARGLEDLNIQMKDLDPSGIDFLKAGPFGKLFNPARRYFEKFKTADREIAEIVSSLEKGKKTLQQDNTALQLEEGQMRELTKKLMQSIEMGTQLDEQLSAAVDQARMSGQDEERIKFVEEDLLYPLRQRIQDFQQLLVVNQQGIIAMAILRKNNGELIRSVDRAKLVTVTALRTAVLVASALYDQKIVLDKVNALNETTNNMIGATAKLLKEQGAQIQAQASEPAIQVETLQNAFADTLQALDDISKYKQEALPRMRETIDQFSSMAAEGEKYMQRLENGIE